MASRKADKLNLLDDSMVVSSDDLAEMYGKSWDWARALLLRWEEEQNAGKSSKRVFRVGKSRIYTTITVLQREMPPARDMPLVREVTRIDRDVDELARRVNNLTDELHRLRGRKVG